MFLQFRPFLSGTNDEFIQYLMQPKLREIEKASRISGLGEGTRHEESIPAALQIETIHRPQCFPIGTKQDHPSKGTKSRLKEMEKDMIVELGKGKGV
ncbi:hypothetical protein SDJN03_25910, partial [Cucurbita argyrosperma subsp. sororia]